ncbi:MAG: signal peptidase II [Myxococcota bacterium]
MKRSQWWFAVTLPLLFGFDWGTKEAARELPLGGRFDVVPGWVGVLHAENPYVAFSFPLPYAVIVTFGVAALIALGFMFTRLGASRLEGVALASIVAGAAGNLVDRLVDGTVTDFVHLYTAHPAVAPWLVDTFGTSSWPIFNVADVALLVGAVGWVARTAAEPESDPPSAALDAG